MKIGICGIGYQCNDHLADVLQPWLCLKAGGRHEILISVAHGIFPEVYSFSLLNPEVPDGSVAALRAYYLEGKIDALLVSAEPQYEWDMRTSTLPFLLNREIELLWLLDLQDEIYSVDEILRIVEFIEHRHEIVWFAINFKNYAFAYDSYVEDFIVPRVWRARIPAAIRCFHNDNSVTYEDGQKQENLRRCAIPRKLAFPRHLSWVGTPDYLKRKIRYQNLHFGLCSYRWDEEHNCLQFNEEYYLHRGRKIPTVYKDVELNS